MEKSSIDSTFEFEKSTASNNIEVLLLKIISNVDLKSLNFRLPNLRYLNFVTLENVATLTIADSELNGVFETLVKSFFESIESDQRIEHNLYILKSTINEFLKLAEKKKSWNENQLKGFYAELLKLEELLSKEGKKSEILAGWQRPNMANHDFTYDKIIYEVKAIGLHRTSVKITSEYQMANPTKKDLHLEVYRIESLKSKFEDSIAGLYNRIIATLDNSLLTDEFKSKCEADQLNYCGPDIHEIPFKFILHDHSTYQTNSLAFPKILPVEGNMIFNVNYEISLSAIEIYKLLEI